MSFREYACGIRLPKCSKLVAIGRMAMTSQFPEMTSSSTFSEVVLFLLSSFVYWSKFHVNIIAGSGVMTISFYKRLTRTPEIGNTTVWVLPNIWRLGRVRNTKYGTNVSHKMLQNAAKFQGYSFYRFWVIKGKPTGGGGKITPPPPVHSTSWKRSLHFLYIFGTDWNFLIKFCSSDPSFNRDILRSLYLKFQTSAHAHIAITYYYVLFTTFLS